MLRISWSCSGCNNEGMVNDLENMFGQCPECGCHHGEVEYECKMNKDEFIDELAKMSYRQMIDYGFAIHTCAEQLSEK